MVASLARRGAQIVLLTHHAPNDPFLVDYIDDLRAGTNNELIYAEQVDLSSLQSIRLFATKWIDNAPPRRLDMIVLCADSMTPRFGVQPLSEDKVENTWAVNFLANFHLLSILSPAIKIQPPHRDVRIIFGTCSSYLAGDLKSLQDSRTPLPKGKEYGASKLATMIFAQVFQKHLDSYERPDKQANNARTVLVDPGFSRTPGMRRWLTMGTLWGLMLYLVTWPFWWLVLKSPIQGAQSFLYAAMEAELGTGRGGRLIKECRDMGFLRKEVQDEEVAKKLWTFSERQIEALEKEGAIKRSKEKKEKTAKGKPTEAPAEALVADAPNETTQGQRKKKSSKRRNPA